MCDQGRKNLDLIRQYWTPQRVARRMIWLDETASTNTVALDMATVETDADTDGLVVLADYQTAGRGRQGRRWLSPRGASVLCSVAVVEPCVSDTQVQPNSPVGSGVAGRLNVLAAVAAGEALAESTELRAGIKWPNDLRISDRKVGGILIESRSLDASPGSQAAAGNGRRAWVMGFGINCLQHAGHFPPELAEQATSLELAASHPVDRLAVIRALLMRLDYWLGAPDWLYDARLNAAWTSMVEPIGQRIKLRYQGRDYAGRTIAADPVGGLTVQLDNGRQMWFDPMLTSVVP